VLLRRRVPLPYSAAEEEGSPSLQCCLRGGLPLNIVLEGRSISLPFTVADEKGFPSIYSSAAEEEGSRQYSADEEEGSLHCSADEGEGGSPSWNASEEEISPRLLLRRRRIFYPIVMLKRNYPCTKVLLRRMVPLPYSAAEEEGPLTI
jgi:hypothetical protein